jgi:hypothetical protein
MNADFHTESPSRHCSGVSWRSVLIVVVLLPLNMYWHVQMEALRYTFPSLMAPFYSVIFDLLVLTVLNVPLKKFAPRYALASSELVTIYVLLSAGVLFMSYDMFLPLVSIMAHAFWFRSAANQWDTLFIPYLPKHLTVRDPDAVRDFYRGGASFYEHWQHWLVPCLWWCGFTLALMVVCLSINVILRKQWMEHERLSYPIVYLPYEIAFNPGGLFRQRLFWGGFTLAASIALLNGLNLLDARFPSIPNKGVPLSPMFETSPRPWSALAKESWSLIVYPWAVGLGFIMPLDLLVSCQIFFWLHKAQFVLGATLGWDTLPNFPFKYEQNVGAYTAIASLVLWSARRHMAYVLRMAYGVEEFRGADAREPLSYRLALIGIILGAGFLLWFCVHGGMSWWVAVLFFAAHGAIAVTLTRIRAEVGFPIHSTTFIGPHHSLVSLLGTKTLGVQNLTFFALYFWFNRDNRSHPMPHQAEAFFLAERGNINSRQLTGAMLGVSVVAMPLCLWILLSTLYRLGVSSGHVGAQINSFGGRAYGQFLQNWINSPTSTDWHGVGAMTFGFLFTLFLYVLRTRYMWWAIHPLGYSLAVHTDLFWAAFLLSAVAKSWLLKFGGLKVYRQALPFFMGLVIGDFVMGAFWNFLSIALNRALYQIYY